MTSKFKRQDLVQYISAQAEITAEQAQESISALGEGIAYILRHKNKICLKNFGIFTVKEILSRNNGKVITSDIKCKILNKRLNFKASKELYNIMNKLES